eukprot:5005529-Pyramimonas_sp.AAC.1
MIDQSDAGSVGIFSRRTHQMQGAWDSAGSAVGTDPMRAQESNSLVAEWLNKGLMGNPQLGHFFGVRKYSGGELRNSPVVEWLNKGLMA